MLKSSRAIKFCLFVNVVLIFSVVASFLILVSSNVMADDSVIDDVNVSVPISCTMQGYGMDSHTASIQPGTVVENIGETSITVYCNDAYGFGIYAIGYTQGIDGKNYLVSTDLDYEEDIFTGTGTSGNSQWAMRILPDINPDPPFPAYVGEAPYDYFAVPFGYTLVASRSSSTDIGNAAVGSTFRTTYRAYISPTQTPGTYEGKVKYVLVHPSSVNDQALSDAVTVVYNGNGLTFPDGSTTNTVKYAKVCEPTRYGYVGNNYEEAMTSNISSGGTQSGGAYSDSEDIQKTISFPNADKILVEANYTASSGLGYEIHSQKYYDGVIDLDSVDSRNYTRFKSIYKNLSGSDTYLFDDNTLSVYINNYSQPESGYDYGVYMKFYPVYNDSHENATYRALPSLCSVRAISGEYLLPNGWIADGGYWTTSDLDGYSTFIFDEVNLLSEIGDTIEGDEEFKIPIDIIDTYKGTTINLLARSPYKVYYDGNGATAGTMSGVATMIETNDNSSSATLIAPNFYKTGYGFVGWSTNPNAVANSSDIIFGPNQSVTGADFTFNSSRSATLYAVWLESSGSMQSYLCETIPSGDVIALTDDRDGQTYSVVKLNDKSCWMMENLRLGTVNIESKMKCYSGTVGGSACVDTGYTSSINKFRDSSEGYGGSFSGLANPESSLGGTNSNSLHYIQNNTDGTQEDVDLTFYGISGSGAKISLNNSAYVFPRFNDINTRESTITSSPSNSYSSVYAYGNYYTWAAAMANTNSIANDVNPSSSSRTSICPKNWRLPVSNSTSIDGDSSREYYGLVSARDVSELRNYPTNFVYSGMYYQSYVNGTGFYGRYWSASSYSSSEANIFNLNGTDLRVILDLTSTKTYGHPVRCVRRIGIDY